MSLEIKEQNAKTDQLFLRVNSGTQCTSDCFRGSNASPKVELMYLETLEQTAMVDNFVGWTTSRKLGEMILQVAKH